MTAASILVPLTLGFAIGNWTAQAAQRDDVAERVFYGVLAVFAAVADIAFLVKF
jgi:hypothetical protein